MSSSHLIGLLKSMDSDLMNDSSLIDSKRVPSGSVSGSESGSVVVNKHNVESTSSIRQESSLNHIVEQDSSDDLSSSDEEQDDFNDYVIEPPLPPPKELNPDKLYALFEFVGDDASHCELERDEPVTLLNDQDGYWWLVRKESNGKIGFAPAECLETHEERLARLNCWKNEELEKNSKDFLPIEENRSKLELRSNKSVTFSNEVDVADENSIKEQDDSSDEENLEDDSEEEKYIYETPYVGEEGEIVSDIMPIVTPLTVNKKSTSTSNSFRNMTMHYPDSDIEDTSPLIAPNASFFNQNNFSGSIGSYSPSSSEFDSPENTPQLSIHHNKRNSRIPISEIKGNIPESTATINIAKSIQMLDELMNDELNHNHDDSSTEREFDSNDDNNTISYDDNDSSKLASPIELSSEQNHSLRSIPTITSSNLSKKSISPSNTADSTSFINSNSSLQLTSSSTTMDELTQVHSDSSSTAYIPTTTTTTTSPKFKALHHSITNTELHPEISNIYEDSFSKIDQLTAKLEHLNELMK